jgi:hypothetical protein
MIPDANIDSSHRSSTSYTNSTSKLKSKSDRRRCLKTLFHIPLGARSKSQSCGYDDIDIDIDGTSMKANTSTTLVCSALPQDIIREIVDLLPPSDILSFSLTVRVFFFDLGFLSLYLPVTYIPCLSTQSSHVRTLLLPALYDTIILKSSKHCRLTLTMLLTHPHLCTYIKKLAVRPNYYLAWPKSDRTLDENWVVKMIIDLSKYLKNMHTFDWDGLELPQDQLWDELRIK